MSSGAAGRRDGFLTVQMSPLLVAANVYYLVHFPVTVIVLSATFFRDRHGTFVMLRNSRVAVERPNLGAPGWGLTR